MKCKKCKGKGISKPIKVEYFCGLKFIYCVPCEPCQTTGNVK